MSLVSLATHGTVIVCGANFTAVGVFCRRGGRLRLESCACERFSPSTPGEDAWCGATRTALPVLRRRVKSAGRVTCVLPSHLTLIKHIRVPRLSRTKRDRIVRFEAAQGIPYDLAEVSWDTAVAREGVAELELMLAAVKLDAVNAISTASSEARFEPTVMLPLPLSILGAVRLLKPRPREPALVLSVGARSTVILQAEADRFASRIVALGNGGMVRPASDTVTSFAGRLAQEIARSLVHFSRQEGLGKPARILLTGEIADVSGLSEILSARVKLPVEILDVGSILDVAPETRVAAAGLGSTLVALAGAAAGLVSPQPVANLLPPRLRRQAGIRRRRVWLTAAVAMATIAPLPPLIHHRLLARAACAKTAAIEAAIAPMRAQEARNRAALAEIAELRRQLAELRDVEARRTSWIGLLADLQERLLKAEDVWFERLQTIPPAAGSPLKLSVSGRMLDKADPSAKVSPETINRVQSLLAGLAASPYVAAVEHERFDNSQPGILKFDFVLVTGVTNPL